MASSLFSAVTLMLAFVLLVIVVSRRCRALFFIPPDAIATTSDRHNKGSNDEKRFDSEAGPPTDFYGDIEPLPDFDWTSTPPQRLRPFKPRYHLTMGLENISLSELIALDSTYLDRLDLRRSVVNSHAEDVVQCNSIAEPAVLELYRWLFFTYLPARFPRIYQIVPSPAAHAAQDSCAPETLRNLATSELIPLEPTSALSALKTIGEHIDGDFLLMLPRDPATSPASPTSDPTDAPLPIYHLEAFITCFPSGFQTKTKLSQPLSAIHAPVPGYETKLARSMDRFFARMPVGRVVRRTNWTVTEHPDLFTPDGTHSHTDLSAEALAAERRKVDLLECRLRVERQTLFRLPGSRALVFAFKTYTETLDEVKQTGDGNALADAIEGLALGSVPQIAAYKRQVVWGETVAEYLRRPN